MRPLRGESEEKSEENPETAEPKADLVRHTCTQEDSKESTAMDVHLRGLVLVVGLFGALASYLYWLL